MNLVGFAGLARPFGLGPASPAAATIEEAIHERIADLLAGTFGGRHFTGATPWPNPDPQQTPYLVLSGLGASDEHWTSGRRKLVDYEFQAAIVADDASAARRAAVAFSRAFTPWSPPLKVDDGSYSIAVVTRSPHPAPAALDDVAGTDRVQFVVPFRVTLSETSR